MKPGSPVHVATLVLLFMSALLTGDLVRLWGAASSPVSPDVSPTSDTASRATVPVKVLAGRIQTEDPALPAWYLDGVRIWDARFPSARPGSSAGDAPVRAKDPAAWLTDSLGGPRPVRTETVERDETTPIRGDAAPVGASRFEPDVRAILRDMQVGFGPVAGQPEMVPQTEADGTVLYRVRVGPFAKDDAERLCNALREGGGLCPMARE